MQAQVFHSCDPSLAVSASAGVTVTNGADPKIRTSTVGNVQIGGAGVCQTDRQIIEGIWCPQTDPTATGLLPLIMQHGKDSQPPAVDRVGTSVKLNEPMALTDCGCINLRARHDKPSDASHALTERHHGKIKGRAVLIR